MWIISHFRVVQTVMGKNVRLNLYENGRNKQLMIHFMDNPSVRTYSLEYANYMKMSGMNDWQGMLFTTVGRSRQPGRKFIVEDLNGVAKLIWKPVPCFKGGRVGGWNMWKTLTGCMQMRRRCNVCNYWQRFTDVSEFEYVTLYRFALLPLLICWIGQWP